MNPIEEAIDAISSATWAELLADGTAAIIALCMVFVLIDQGKRLLRMTADAYGDGGTLDDERCPFCGRQTFGDACYCTEGDTADSMEAAAEGIDENGQFVADEDVEEATLQCPECGHENMHGDIYPDNCCAECGHQFED